MLSLRRTTAKLTTASSSNSPTPTPTPIAMRTLTRAQTHLDYPLKLQLQLVLPPSTVRLPCRRLDSEVPVGNLGAYMYTTNAVAPLVWPGPHLHQCIAQRLRQPR